MQVHEAIALDSIQAIAASFGSTFDAEKIIDTVVEKDGTRYYKVRWVKYSWEPEASFTHLEHLIQTFWEKEKENQRFDSIKTDLPIVTRPIYDETSQFNQCPLNRGADTIPPQPHQQIQQNCQDNFQQQRQKQHELQHQPQPQHQQQQNHQQIQQHQQQPQHQQQEQQQHQQHQQQPHHQQQQNHQQQQQQLQSHHQQQKQLITEIDKPDSILTDLEQFVASFTSVHTSSCDEQRQLVQSLSESLQNATQHVDRLQLLSPNIQELDLQEVTGFHSPETAGNTVSLLKDSNGPNQHPLPPIQRKEEKKRRKIPGQCDICGKHFKSTTNIAAHRKLHTEEKKFECPQCSKKFRRKLHLERHLKSHAGIKSFNCEICGAKFSSKWYMQEHAVIHTGDKPFQCTLCDKRFNNKANFNKHRRTHTNQRPFVCNVCGQTYRQNYDLKRHMTLHTDVKSFECAQCKKTFARKSYLQRHVLTHSEERKHECLVCNRKFLQRGNLNFHTKIHQSETVPTTTTSTTSLKNDKEKHIAKGSLISNKDLASTDAQMHEKEKNAASETTVAHPQTNKIEKNTSTKRTDAYNGEKATPPSEYPLRSAELKNHSLDISQKNTSHHGNLDDDTRKNRATLADVVDQLSEEVKNNSLNVHKRRQVEQNNGDLGDGTVKNKTTLDDVDV